VLAVERRCPTCHNRPLTRHSSGLRWVYTIAERFQIVVFRLRCRPCRLTATLLPETLVPYHRYAAVIIAAAVTRSLTAGGSCRRVAIALAAPQLPDDQSVTDALLSVTLKPSYQRIHAWLSRITDLAPDYTTALVTWALRLRPESPLLPHLSVPLNAVRPVLKPLALLVHLLAVVGKSGDWLPTLNRFVFRIAGRIPWRRPPPCLPQSS
jgi:hypothetical protein